MGCGTTALKSSNILLLFLLSSQTIAGRIVSVLRLMQQVLILKPTTTVLRSLFMYVARASTLCLSGVRAGFRFWRFRLCAGAPGMVLPLSPPRVLRCELTTSAGRAKLRQNERGEITGIYSGHARRCIPALTGQHSTCSAANPPTPWLPPRFLTPANLTWDTTPTTPTLPQPFYTIREPEREGVGAHAVSQQVLLIKQSSGNDIALWRPRRHGPTTLSATQLP